MEMSLVEKTYLDPKNPGSFGGVERLYRQLKSKGFTRKDVKDYLRGNETYTLHKDRRFRFRKNRVVAFSKDFQWMADLADMQKYSKQNHGYKYILVVIDVFTKYIWARALHSKQPRSVTQAFENIFDLDGRKPLRLQTDRGREFDSAYLREMGPEFPRNNFRGFHKACIMTCKNELGGEWTVPAGEYTAEIYRELVNETIKEFNKFTGNGLYGYTRKLCFEWNSKLDRIELIWDYGNNLWRKVYLYPFVGEVGNAYLGLPSPTSNTWKLMMAKTLELHGNILLTPGNVADSTDIILQCNLIGQNSNIAITTDKNDVDGRCLRIISQSRFRDLNHGESVRISFDNDPIYLPFRSKLISSMQFRLVSTRTLKPIPISGLVNLTLEFSPMHMSSNMEEVQEERNWIASRPHEVDMWSRVETAAIQLRKD